MGWIGQTRRIADRLTTTRPTGSSATVLSSQRVDLSIRLNRRAFGKPSARQTEAWNAYELVGEIGYVVDFFANCARRVSLFPAVKGEEGMIPAEDADVPFPAGLIEQARVELERIAGPEGGQAEVLGQMAVAYKVPGEGWLCAIDDPVDGEVWRVLSRDSLVARDGAAYVKLTPEDRGTRLDPERSFLARFWRASPRWPGMPFSELMRILDHAESLQLISKSFRAASLSRVAGAGVLFVDQDANLQSSSGIPDEDWLDDFIRHGSAPIREPGSVSAFLPFVTEIATGGGERTVSDMVHHLTFERPLTEIEVQREATLLKRIAYGLDAPAELVTGMADLNHWTAWQVEDSTYQAHVEPLMGRIADVIAQQVMRYGLRQLRRWPDEEINRLLVGVNADELISRPDPAKDALDAHNALVISDAVLRRRLRFSDEDAPSDDELLRRMALKRGITTEQLTRELLQLYAGGEEIPDRIYNQRGEVVGSDADGDGQPDETPSADTRTDAATPDTNPNEARALLAAATGDDLGDLLDRIDRQLVDRLQAAADAAIRRAMERAANRVRNLARRSPHAQTANDVDPLRLGTIRPVLDALAITDDDLFTDADLAQLEQQWEEWTEEAVVAVLLALYARGLVTESQLADLGFTPTGARIETANPASDRVVAEAVDDWSAARTAGWAILAAAVLDRLRTIIDVGPDETPPAVGEFDPGMLIQTGPIREALAVAGGASGSVAQGGAVLVDAGTRPAGELATGEITVRVVNAAGGELVGFEWRTGAPRFPFAPHQALAGQVFSSWDDRTLANTGGEWPGYPTWFPGDHPGCRCSTAPRFDLPPPVDSTPDRED